MKTTYGMAKGKGQAYEPATKGEWPEEQLWSTEKYLDFTPKLFDAVRNKFGFNEHLLHDMHHRLTPIEAARFGKAPSRIVCSGWKIRRRRKSGLFPPDPSAYRHADRRRRGVQQHLGLQTAD